MLVLTLPEGEIVQIGLDVRIFISRAQNGRVAIAFDAPRNVEIQRLSPREPATEPQVNGMTDVVMRRRRKSIGAR